MAKGTSSHGLCAPISVIQVKSQTVLGEHVQCSLYTFLSTPTLLEVNNSIQITLLEWNFQKLPTPLPKYIQICIYIYIRAYVSSYSYIYLFVLLLCYEKLNEYVSEWHLLYHADAYRKYCWRSYWIQQESCCLHMLPFKDNLIIKTVWNRNAHVP